MQTTQRLRGPSDRTLNRLIVGGLLVLLVGIPLIVALYAMDQFRSPGPSILERSVAAGEEAVRKNPNQVGARLQLASVYLAADRYADARNQYDEVLKVQADNRTALTGRGLALISLKDLPAAKASFQQLVDLAKGGEQANADPQLEAAYYQLGLIALQQGDARAALDPLEKALAITRTDADALSLYGTAKLQLGDPKAAVTSLRKAIALVPTGWCDPYAELGKAYTALGDGAGAGYATGMVAACEKRSAEAKAALQPLVTGPYAVDAMLGLGLIAEDEGDSTTATAMYAKVLTSDPKNFSAISGLNRLGVVVASGAPSSAPSAAPSSDGTN